MSCAAGVMILLVVAIARVEAKLSCPVEKAKKTMFPIFCQPAEEKGEYGPRHWTMPRKFLGDHLRTGKCFTLDDMICDGRPSWCLKWGDDAYAGRVMLPEGLILKGFGSWHCRDKHRFRIFGPTSRPHDFWEFDWRVNCFQLSLKKGYTFDAAASPPVQLEKKHQCVPKDVVGRWTYWFSQQTNDEQKVSLTIGLEQTHTETDQQTYTNEFGATVGYSVKVGNAMAGGEHEFSAELSYKHSTAISHSTTKALKHSKSYTEQKTFRGAGTYWQFVMYAENAGGVCKSRSAKVYLSDVIRTQNVAEPPCCAPGLFKNIDNPVGDCVDGAPRLCSKTPPRSEL